MAQASPPVRALALPPKPIGVTYLVAPIYLMRKGDLRVDCFRVEDFGVRGLPALRGEAAEEAEEVAQFTGPTSCGWGLFLCPWRHGRRGQMLSWLSSPVPPGRSLLLSLWPATVASGNCWEVRGLFCRRPGPGAPVPGAPPGHPVRPGLQSPGLGTGPPQPRLSVQRRRSLKAAPPGRLPAGAASPPEAAPGHLWRRQSNLERLTALPAAAR